MKPKFLILPIIIGLILCAYGSDNYNSEFAKKIIAKINQNKKISLQHFSVSETEPGYITLEGIADLYGEKYYSQKIAEELHPIKINNKIIVEPNIKRNDLDIEQELFNKIKNELIDGYFDDVSFKVTNGVVILYGKIKRVHLLNRIMEIAIWMPGVRHVENNMAMLPVSKQDDDIRLSILKKMKSDLRTAHYFVGSFPSIIIVVERGNVTLKGYVNSKADKIIMGQIANSIIGVLSVTNLIEISAN